MEHIIVRNEETLEIVGKTLVLEQKQFSTLSNNEPLDDEKEYYSQIESQIAQGIKLIIEKEGFTSRKLIFQNSECISLIQFLLFREENHMFVHMRSSSTARIASDLGFLTRLAKKYDITVIHITISSFHVILKGA